MLYNILTAFFKMNFFFMTNISINNKRLLNIFVLIANENMLFPY